ncbi:MAG TPA: helix-turn-helix transcriptional regulator [Streptosporangiaceae bacterium]|nr:helix-turn-helix transcriptional regulator [Streptosporangiaceae bacterium]
MASLGQLLRQLRIDAGLTQEELAEAASLSPRSISDLERGVSLTARKETARLLADALHLAGSDRVAFEAVARGRAPADGVAAATRTLPRDIASFTGREAELRQIAAAANTGGVVGIYAIGGMAGVGKTAFAVHAAHRLAPFFPDGQVFLQLHAHTPGHLPADPAEALAGLLQTIGVTAQRIPAGLESRMGLWRDRLAGKKLLLLLDDAADSEQIRPLLPGSAGCMVLVTSRRHLTALEDARAISLDILCCDEAAGLLVELAARPGLDRSDRAVAEISRLCGYLPLALGMLARRLHHHPAWTAADLAAELAAARDRLDLMHAEDASVAAAFDLSYQDLTEDQQRLFRRLGLHPGTDVDAYAAAALDDARLAATRRDLEGLYDRYLLTEPARGRYRFHDLIREHARVLAAADLPAERDAAAGRLLNYYLFTSLAADRRIARRLPAVLAAEPVIRPEHAEDLAEREDAVSWMEAERLNLHAAVGYAAACGRPGHAGAIAAAMHEFLRSHGHWDQAVALHDAALEAARDAGDQLAEARALTDLGDIRYLSDDYREAGASLARALELYRGLGDRLGEASALSALGTVQQATGDLPAAGASLAQAIQLYRGLGDRLGEANALTDLGTVQCLGGEYPAAAASQDRALEVYRDLGDRLGEANALADLGAVQCRTQEFPAAAASLSRALELYRDLGDRSGEAEALNNMGELSLASAVPGARACYERALTISIGIAAPREEARALEGIGLCHFQDGHSEQGAALLRQARAIYQRIGSPYAKRVETQLRVDDV